MKNTTLFLPGFHLSTLRRKPRSGAQRLADEMARIRLHSISQLGDCFRHFIPAKTLENKADGAFSRRRLFSKANTFWAFFSQILDADGGCQEVVRKVQALAATRSMPMPSASTSAYCQARSKLDSAELETILGHTAKDLQEQGRSRWWKDRRVVVVDGTGVSMADTPANQEVWPQPASQKPGCGFPQARICACFCLQTGALLSYRMGHNKNAELPLLRQQWGSFSSGDIFLGDKGFCSFYDVWQFKERGVDSVITLARRTPVVGRCGVGTGRFVDYMAKTGVEQGTELQQGGMAGVARTPESSPNQGHHQCARDALNELLLDHHAARCEAL